MTSDEIKSFQRFPCPLQHCSAPSHPAGHKHLTDTFHAKKKYVSGYLKTLSERTEKVADLIESIKKAQTLCMDLCQLDYFHPAATDEIIEKLYALLPELDHRRESKA